MDSTRTLVTRCETLDTGSSAQCTPVINWSTRRLTVALPSSNQQISLPAHRTATGKALLAELTPGQLDELLPTVDSADAADGLTKVERDALDAELAQVRELGYATNYREAEDIVSVATVVRDSRGIAVGALNASAPSSRMSKKRQLSVIRQLHASAARLEELLGEATGS